MHYLSGPIGIEGAEPGDALVVEILDVQPFDSMPTGFTGVFELNNGGGLFSKDFNTRAAKAIWDFEGVYATSRHIPGVRFAGVMHPGLIGTAPSQELLNTWNTREQGLIDAHPTCCVPGKFFFFLPRLLTLVQSGVSTTTCNRWMLLCYVVFITCSKLTSSVPFLQLSLSHLSLRELTSDRIYLMQSERRSIEKELGVFRRESTGVM